MGFKRFLLALLMLAAAQPALSQPIPVEDFWKRSSFREVKISPDGRYLAATVPFEKLTALVVMDLATSLWASSRSQE